MNFYIGHVKNYKGGWIMGQFLDHPLLHNDVAEIGWKKFPEDYSEPPHYHKKASELSIVIKGRMLIKEGKNIHTLKKGDFIFLLKNTWIQDYCIKKGTEVIVIKTPSIPNDKYFE